MGEYKAWSVSKTAWFPLGKPLPIFALLTFRICSTVEIDESVNRLLSSKIG